MDMNKLNKNHRIEKKTVLKEVTTELDTTILFLDPCITNNNNIKISHIREQLMFSLL